jgi:hypothetical protein
MGFWAKGFDGRTTIRPLAAARVVEHGQPTPFHMEGKGTTPKVGPQMRPDPLAR